MDETMSETVDEGYEVASWQSQLMQRPDPKGAPESTLELPAAPPADKQLFCLTGDDGSTLRLLQAARAFVVEISSGPSKISSYLSAAELRLLGKFVKNAVGDGDPST
jgi:hypothetical protein